MKVNEAISSQMNTINLIKEKVVRSNLDEKTKEEVKELIYLLRQDCSNVNKTIATALEKFAFNLK